MKTAAALVLASALSLELVAAITPRDCGPQLVGIDFYGGDVANVRGPVSSCCDACKQRQDCDRWSWSNYNGGTCWLKGPSGYKVQANGGVTSAILYPSGTNGCPAPIQDLDLYGADVANKKGKSTDCCAACQGNKDCKFWTWSDWEGGTCWLKSSTGKPTVSSGRVSSFVVGSPITTTPVVTTTPAITTTPAVTTTPPPANEVCYSGTCLRGNYKPNGWALAGQDDTPPCWKNEGSYWSCFDYLNGKCPWEGMTNCKNVPQKFCGGWGAYCGVICFNPARMMCCFTPSTGEYVTLWNFINNQPNNECQPPRKVYY